MIILNKLTFSNWFSYGDNNEIDFSQNVLTQIKGLNGSGKSSIQLILEEVLFGKNSKNIKKADISNRNTENHISADLQFSVDEINYRISYDRKSTIKLSLYKGGENVSSHTSRGTYETIQNILGLDFNTFKQIAFQDSKNSLGFLTATDTQRKSFLTSLFGLDKYAKYLEVYKKASRELVGSKATLVGECSTLSAFITKYSSMDFNTAAMMKVVDKPVTEAKELGVLEESLKNLATTNTSRTKNNTYKEMLDAVDMSFLSYSEGKPKVPVYKIYDNKDKILAEGKIKDAEKENKELFKLGGDRTCSKCHQGIDIELVENIIAENDNIITISKDVVEDAIKVAKQFDDKIKKLKNEYTTKVSVYNKMQKNLTDFETLTSQFDTTLETDLIDSNVLKTDITNMKAGIKMINDSIDEAVENNTAAVDKNSKIKVVKKQLEEHRAQLDIATKKLVKIEILEANVSILKKAFSSTGVIAFKLEFLAKTLEKEINSYLSELSSGRFSLEFVLENEKLNIAINDIDNIISISALSSGELARVNTATLLAIRKMMSAISGNEVNILILDELLSVLDIEGKDSLVSLLLEEHGLNSFLIDHSFSHPLLANINIEKKDGISILEQE